MLTHDQTQEEVFYSSAVVKHMVPEETCPCCSYPLLQHIGHQRVYWFCRSCWQKMPLLSLAHHASIALSPGE